MFCHREWNILDSILSNIAHRDEIKEVTVLFLIYWNSATHHPIYFQYRFWNSGLWIIFAFGKSSAFIFVYFLKSVASWKPWSAKSGNVAKIATQCVQDTLPPPKTMASFTCDTSEIFFTNQFVDNEICLLPLSFEIASYSYGLCFSVDNTTTVHYGPLWSTMVKLYEWINYWRWFN